jgi:hypothetical protein
MTKSVTDTLLATMPADFSQQVMKIATDVNAKFPYVAP